MILFIATPPSQRIQFLLGEDEDDDDHKTHDVFCEMEELFYKDDEMEWKETARYHFEFVFRAGSSYTWLLKYIYTVCQVCLEISRSWVQTPVGSFIRL